MSKPLYVIKPRRGLASLNLAELWQFRDLFLAFAMRDLRLRYRQTALGVAWVVLQPLIAAAIFAFVFGRIAGLKAPAGVPYFLFAYAGMTCWTLFFGIVSRSAGLLTQNTALVSKVYFPRLIMPLSLALTVLVDLAVALLLLLVLMPIQGVPFTWQMVLVPIIILLVLLLATGVACIASALAVPYRDVQYVTPVFLNLLLFISPIGYAASTVPEGGTRTLYNLNPLAPLVESLRNALLGTGPVESGPLIYAGIVSLLVFLVGATVFRNMERRFADVI
jgi:lipopolysaccharide transport system permease protein